jgi:DNA primase
MIWGERGNMAQISDIKERLLEDTGKIVELLEAYDFAHIAPRPQEIRFARDDKGGRNISIRLQNNEWLNVSDYSHGFRGDIFSYIAQERNVTFREVLQVTKKILNLNDSWEPKKTYQIFGGIYSRIYKQNEYVPPIYSEDILKAYHRCGNLLWLKDNISLEAQKFYDVHFDPVENAIVFPWRDCYGSIIAVKSRYNGEPPEGMSKYYYPLGGSISYSFFNYSQCYEHLYNNAVYLFESEKSCMIAWSRGIKNTLAIGSNSLSPTQCKLLLQLQPKEIYLMLDSDLDLAETRRNAGLIKQYMAMSYVPIKFWDWRNNLSLGAKCSPMDGTLEQWNYILANEIRSIEELTEEEDEI